MREKGLSIYPLDLGTLMGMDKSFFTIRRNQGILVNVPCLAWVVSGGERTILVDSGPADPDWARKYHRPLKKDSSQEIENALRKIGLSKTDIKLIIFTHLHWDHCFNLELFPEVKFIIQKKELEYAVNPLPADRPQYEAGVPEIQPPWMKVFGRMKPVDGDQDIIPGVRVIHLPGHTPGFQGVVVETAEGPWVIAGDAVPLFENWDPEDAAKRIPGGIYQNLFDYESTLQKLGSIGNRILPGHDPKVTEDSVFPRFRGAGES